MRPDFPMLARDLEASGAALDAASLHGAVCGWLCAGRSDASGLCREMLATAEALERLPGDWLERSLTIAAQELDDVALGFCPWLPSDERPLAERVRALATWCDAFLGAYGIGGGGTDDEESGAILADLAAIARADDAGVDDSDEEAFVEILEYVRMSAVYLRTLSVARAESGR
jgi:uncharacterized protein YgfB (UPF0149 family)